MCGVILFGKVESKETCRLGRDLLVHVVVKYGGKVSLVKVRKPLFSVYRFLSFLSSVP